MSQPMSQFEQYAVDGIRAALARIDANEAADIYALSFFVDELDDDPRRPFLSVSYNTVAQLHSCGASDPAEAKWNFAFWLQHDIAAFGHPGAGDDLLETLLRGEGLWYTDAEEQADFDAYTEVGEKIGARFVQLCSAIAMALHSAGVVEQRFGRPIPILLHGLEYHDQVAQQTRAANPPGLTQEFEDWIAAMYRN